MLLRRTTYEPYVELGIPTAARAHYRYVWKNRLADERCGDDEPKGGEKMLSMVQASIDYLRARFAREDGAVTTEYGLLIVFIALAVIAGMIPWRRR